MGITSITSSTWQDDMPDGRARGLRSYESAAGGGAAGRISPRVSGDVPRHACPRRLSYVISRLWSTELRIVIAAGAIRAAYDPSVLGDSFGPIALFDVGAAIASAALVAVFVASAVRNTRSCIPPSVVRGALATARPHDARCPCSGRDAQHVRAAARRSDRAHAINDHGVESYVGRATSHLHECRSTCCHGAPDGRAIDTPAEQFTTGEAQRSFATLP